MRGFKVATGAINIAVGLAWLVLLWIDQGRDPAKRRIPRARPFYAPVGMWFLATGLWWIVRGLRG
jgi:hypothetical protein